ncbi:hypothetical protein CYMTET_26000 [Cymbomonas tetramitiformis]|uniref:Plastid lipid-associated protein/fibrillin conserved domain-containing protein n=1 Tax=Cymbomonas tetramitiformis TaxID=36881 RepID=A0AAE0FSP8_9CHLO|nr:hypothetical protein CYMTET_26000 [Cymbomonas tetramitiformis]
MIRNKNRGRSCSPEERADILAVFEELELLKPAPGTLLQDAELAKLLDGQWFLQYTASGTEETAAETVPGSVNAAGIEVDTSNNATIVQQNIDVNRQTLQNLVLTRWGGYYVDAKFKCSESCGQRADITFETFGFQIGPLRFSTKLLFALINWKRKDGGAWLTTTFVDDSMRLARGNKGSVFILTKKERI